MTVSDLAGVAGERSVRPTTSENLNQTDPNQKLQPCYQAILDGTCTSNKVRATTTKEKNYEQHFET
jgi:hypothetical protein